MGETKRNWRVEIDPRLHARFHGGPLDGSHTADFPPNLAGKPLTGVEVQWPLSEPAQFSLYAVYRCTAAERFDGEWRFDFVRLQGPDGERLIANPRRQPVRDASVGERLDERKVLELLTDVMEHGAPVARLRLMPTRARICVPGAAR